MRTIHKYICINMHICMIFQICIYSLAFHWNQTNLLIHFLNIFCKIIIFLPTPGVYELVIFEMKPGGPPLWGNAFKRAINAHVDLGYSKLIGVFHTEYGALNRGTVVHFFQKTAKYIGDLLSSLELFVSLFHYGIYFNFCCQFFSFFVLLRVEKNLFYILFRMLTPFANAELLFSMIQQND